MLQCAIKYACLEPTSEGRDGMLHIVHQIGGCSRWNLWPWKFSMQTWRSDRRVDDSFMYQKPLKRSSKTKFWIICMAPSRQSWLEFWMNWSGFRLNFVIPWRTALQQSNPEPKIEHLMLFAEFEINRQIWHRLHRGVVRACLHDRGDVIAEQLHFEYTNFLKSSYQFSNLLMHTDN